MRRRRSRVFTLIVRRPDHGIDAVELDRFPFVIGRSPEASLRLEAPGVWDRHLVFDLDPARGVFAEPGTGASATVGGLPFEHRWVRNGDEFTLGGIRAQVLLSPVRRVSLVQWEIALWGVFAAVAFFQVLMVWRFLDS